MTDRIISGVQSGSCPAADINNCLECEHFCGIKKNAFDIYTVECGLNAQKGEKQ